MKKGKDKSKVKSDNTKLDVKAEGVRTRNKDTNKGKYTDMPLSDILQTKKSINDNKASSSPSSSTGEKQDKGDFMDVIREESESELLEAESTKDSDNPTPEQLSKKMNKKRRRHGKTLSDTSEAESLTSSEVEGPKPAIDAFMDTKVDWSEEIIRRIKQIQSRYRQISEMQKNRPNLERYDILNSDSASSNSPTSSMGEKQDKGGSMDVIHEESESEILEAESTKDSDNPTPEQLLKKMSKKRRRRRRGKTLSDTSEAESLTNSEVKGPKPAIDAFMDTKVDWSEECIQRIKQIQSRYRQLSEMQKDRPNLEIYDILNSDSDIDVHLTFDRKSKNYTMTSSKESSPSEKLKRKTVSNNGDESVKNSPKGNTVLVSSLKSKADSSSRPVIFVTDKMTQTDPLPSPPSISEPTDGGSSGTFSLDSGNIDETKAIISAVLPSVDETKSQNISEETEVLSKKVGFKNKSTFIPNFDDIVAVEATEAEDIDTSNKTASSSLSESSLDKNLQTIMQDFVKDMKISSEYFAEGYIKCFK